MSHRTPTVEEIKEGFRYEFSYKVEGTLVFFGKPTPKGYDFIEYTEWREGMIVDMSAWPPVGLFPSIEKQIDHCKELLDEGRIRTSEDLYS